jgi:hypothetical protein
MGRGEPFGDILISDMVPLYYGYIGDVDQALRWTRITGRLTTTTPTSLLIRTPLFSRVSRDPRFVAGIDSINADIWRRVNTPPLKLD